jgi:hypothetical protein
MNAQSEIFVDPWLNKTKHEEMPPSDAEFACMYTIDLNIYDYPESAHFRRTESMDELWLEKHGLRSGKAVAAPVRDEPHEACLKLLDILFRSRVGFDWPTEFLFSGMIDASDYREILEKIEKDLKKARKKPRKNARVKVGELKDCKGRVRYKGEIKGDKPHGQGTEYWPDGVPWCEGAFENGKPHGFCRVYWPTGELRHEGEMEEGLPYGPGTEYYRHGQIWFTGIFGRQNNYYYHGARIYKVGRKYSGDGTLVHDGEFTTGGSHSMPITEEYLESVRKAEEARKLRDAAEDAARLASKSETNVYKYKRERKRRRPAKYVTGMLEITVDYEYDIHSMYISRRTYSRIKSGKKLTIKGHGYVCEDANTIDYWEFNRDEVGSLRVYASDDRDVFIGNLEDGRVWVDSVEE